MARPSTNGGDGVFARTRHRQQTAVTDGWWLRTGENAINRQMFIIYCAGEEKAHSFLITSEEWIIFTFFEKKLKPGTMGMIMPSTTPFLFYPVI
jgi:hypothetical protein